MEEGVSKGEKEVLKVLSSCDIREDLPEKLLSLGTQAAEEQKKA